MKKKPVIGITASYVKHNHYMEGVYVHHDYHKAIVASGGIPLILPVSTKEMAMEYLSMCDGILVSGGEDVDPQFYHHDPHQKLGFVFPERDEVELALIEACLNENKPLLGICRGLQILNVALGGTLIQDLPSQVPTSMQHVQTIPRPRSFHSVKIEKNSQLHTIFEKESVRVNSLHHQSIDVLAKDLKAVSFAGDGIIEAVEHVSKQAWAVQWHPESMFSTSEDMQKLFRSFIQKCI